MGTLETAYSLPWLVAGRRTVIALTCLLLAVVAPPALGEVGRKASGPPVVEGPITGGLRGAPFGAAPLDLARRGYVEQEYFISGTAKTYTTPSTQAAYKTRILVRRPIHAKRFNGTVMVEWTNVTATYDSDNGWMMSFPELTREGYAYAAVSAQQMGVQTGPQSLRMWDPVRYGSLSHPGDDYSFDIFSQAMKAVRKATGLRPLGNLQAPKRAFASGQLQSASRLYSYINLGVHKDARVVDAFLIDAGGATTFPKHEPDVPTIHFLTEEGISPGRRSKAPNYRIWHVPGASHIGTWAGDYAGASNQKSIAAQDATMDEQAAGRYGEQGGQSTSCVGDSEYPRHYALDAAIHQLDVAMRTGRLPARAREVAFKSDGTIVRDQHGNAVGGVRLPPLDVPVATYRGATCGLRGETLPFDDAMLHRLYPTHAVYISKMRAATKAAVRAGYLRPEDARVLLRRAQAAASRWSS